MNVYVHSIKGDSNIQKVSDVALCGQVHIKHAGNSRMLFNKFKLQGIAPKIQKLARREGEVSVATPKSPGVPVVRHSKALETALPDISDDEELELHAVAYESPQSVSRPHKSDQWPDSDHDRLFTRCSEDCCVCSAPASQFAWLYDSVQGFHGQRPCSQNSLRSLMGFLGRYSLLIFWHLACQAYCNFHLGCPKAVLTSHIPMHFCCTICLCQTLQRMSQGRRWHSFWAVLLTAKFYVPANQRYNAIFQQDWIYPQRTQHTNLADTMYIHICFPWTEIHALHMFAQMVHSFRAAHAEAF